MLSTVQAELLLLLKKSMKQDAKNVVSISKSEDWAELYRLAEIHHVVPMVFDALAKTEAYSKADASIQLLWKKQAVSLMILQTRKTEAFLNIYEKLQQAGIKALVVKGIVCRQLYPKPDTRISNDEDILIRECDLKECDRILLEEGFERDEDIENPNYEISYAHPTNSMKIDLHLSLFPNEGVFENLNKEFEKAFETYQTVEINGRKIETLDYGRHFLYLLFHSYKHFIRCGFGIRQLCDMVIMAEEMWDEIDWEFVIYRAKALNMYVFLINLMDIGEKYLGLDADKAYLLKKNGKHADSENLLMDILNAGVYGKSSIGREHSVNITLSAAQNETGKVSLKSSLFPSSEYMKKEYEYLKKHSWLLPVAWSQRMLGYIRRVRQMKKSGTEETNSIVIGKQRVELLKQYGVIK